MGCSRDSGQRPTATNWEVYLNWAGWSRVRAALIGWTGLNSMAGCVKNAEQVLFHSTLEPNTEVFSKVSCGVLRSTKFRLNFAKQRRNDMQPS